MADAAGLILNWARGFHAGELTVEDVQDRFAALDVSASGLPEPLKQAIMRAQQTLDAIRYGMCEEGQRGELSRILTELETLIGPNTEHQQVEPVTQSKEIRH